MPIRVPMVCMWFRSAAWRIDLEPSFANIIAIKHRPASFWKRAGIVSGCLVCASARAGSSPCRRGRARSDGRWPGRRRNGSDGKGNGCLTGAHAGASLGGALHKLVSFECIVHLVYDGVRDACLADTDGCLKPVSEAAGLPDLAAIEFRGIFSLEGVGRTLSICSASYL